ncbi:unnamed protein product [Rhizopus stolonifer]
MSSSSFFLCNICGVYHTSSIAELNRYRRRDCPARASFNGSESDGEELASSSNNNNDFDDGDYIGGQISDNENASMQSVDATDLGPIEYTYQGSYHLTDLTALAMKMLRLYEECNVPRAVQRESTAILNKFITEKLDPATVEGLGDRIPAPDTMVRKLQKINEQLGLIKNVDVCSGGCYLYPEGSTEPTSCPYCGKGRYTNEVGAVIPKSIAVMSVVSIGAALAERLLDDDYREKYEGEIHRDGVYQDIFSDKVFREQYMRSGIMDDTRDIGLLVVVDGFQPKYKKKSTMTSVCCYIMSMDPAERYYFDKIHCLSITDCTLFCRYKNDNVLTLDVIPGPKKPANLMSFLVPIYKEIKQLGESGMVVEKEGVEVYRCKVHLMGNTGDIPGIAELMNHDGHMSTNGCRICDIFGVAHNHAMCFIGEGTLRTFEDLINGRSDLNMPGVSPVITSMPTFSGFLSLSWMGCT